MEGLESFFTASEQLRLFLLSCAFGIPLGILFDVFRVIRLIIPHGKILVAVEDVLFFCIYGVFLMSFVSAAARSEFRAYFCAGNLLGFALYYFTLGNTVVGLLRKLISLIKKGLSLVFGPLSKKFALICEKIRPFFVGSFKIHRHRRKN